MISFAASWVYAAAGDESRADRERAAVLSLKGSWSVGVNVSLHRAMCTVVNGGVREGCTAATSLISELAPSYRSQPVLETGRMVLRAVPMGQRNNFAVRELSEVLALNPPKL